MNAPLDSSRREKGGAKGGENASLDSSRREKGGAKGDTGAALDSAQGGKGGAKGDGCGDSSHGEKEKDRKESGWPSARPVQTRF